MNYSKKPNPFKSRRTYNDICEYWKRTTYDGNVSLSKLAYTTAPTGSFRAKAVSQYMMNRKNEGDINVSNGFVTIETPDDVSFLSPNDLVKFQGIFYRVDNCAKRVIDKTTEFMKTPLFMYIIQLVR